MANDTLMVKNGQLIVTSDGKLSTGCAAPCNCLTPIPGPASIVIPCNSYPGPPAGVVSGTWALSFFSGGSIAGCCIARWVSPTFQGVLDLGFTPGAGWLAVINIFSLTGFGGCSAPVETP